MGDWITTIRTAIRATRIDQGWTQLEFASMMRRLGFDWKRITVAEVERGSRMVHIDELEAMTAAFGWSIADVVSGAHAALLTSLPAKVRDPLPFRYDLMPVSDGQSPLIER